MSTSGTVSENASGLNQAALDLLWHRMGACGDAQAREELICHFLPFARMMAATYFAKRFHDEIEFSDYLQLATLGLIEALDRFDPTYGVQFTTFASKRIHGSILNGLASATDKQQQIALQVRLRQERIDATKEVYLDAGEGDAPQQSASADDLLRRLADIGVGLALCWMLGDSGMVIADQEVADTRHIPYAQVLELKQLQEQVRNLVNTLPVQQRTVIRCHYVQDIPFETIASMLGLSKGRISQIHKQALITLRKMMKERRSCDVAW
jgi:RNA polymerase sigma factor for flagellar operon FliA